MTPQIALLQALHELAPDGEAVALARLAKRLDERVSTLLRTATPLGDAVIAGVPGPGWLQLDVDGDSGRWTARLTAAGRAALATR